ncbi:MAG: hypothetical protein RL685_6188 [Pseudomonadota bacterium]
MYTPLRVMPLRSLLGGFGLLLLAFACDDDAKVIDTGTAAEQPAPSGSGGSQGSTGSTDPAVPSNNTGNSGSTGASPDSPTGSAEGMGGSNGLSNEGPGNGMMTPPPLPPPEGGEVSISGEITEDTTWTADKIYVLDGTSPVFVVGNHTLTIEPGTTIKGQGLGTALVVTRGSRLIANGTVDRPIVFTSGVTPGLRNPGDWGGLVLLGGAPINAAAGSIEGIGAADTRAAYGGPAPNEGDPTHDCGSLQYVRVEFAGFQYVVDQELNGLTLGGCGTQTVIDHVQVHKGLDDGIEVFGGTVDIKHAVITNSADDGLDWDRGWTGRGQFIIVRTDPTASDGAIEADNRDGNNAAAPRSNPTLYNLTLVGDGGSLASPGVVLRRGTYASIHNSIVMGFPVSGLDIRDAESITGATGEGLTLTNSLFFDNGSDGTVHADVANDGTTVPDALDEGPWLAERANQLGVDPGIADAYLQATPNFVPPAASPASTGALATPTSDFFEPAPYIGALPPGGSDWTAGWTSYPAR